MQHGACLRTCSLEAFTPVYSPEVSHLLLGLSSAGWHGKGPSAQERGRRPADCPAGIHHQLVGMARGHLLKSEAEVLLVVLHRAAGR